MPPGYVTGFYFWGCSNLGWRAGSDTGLAGGAADSTGPELATADFSLQSPAAWLESSQHGGLMEPRREPVFKLSGCWRAQRFFPRFLPHPPDIGLPGRYQAREESGLSLYTYHAEEPILDFESRRDATSQYLVDSAAALCLNIAALAPAVSTI